jgi:hypothetical protein
LFSIGSFEILGLGDEFTQLPPFMSDSILPHWLLATTALILVGIPFLVLFVLGLRILSSNVKRFSKTTTLSLLGIWIIALLISLFSLIETWTSHAYNGSKITTETLSLQSTDTLNIKMYNDEELNYEYRLRSRDNKIKVFDEDTEKIYSNYVKVDVEKSSSDEFSIKVRKVSEARKKELANDNAEAIEYEYELNGNDLQLNAYFLSSVKNRYLDERVYITIYAPENATVYFNDNTSSFLYGIYDVDRMPDYRMAEHYFLMTSEGLDCADCEEEVKETDEEPKEETEKDSISE